MGTLLGGALAGVVLLAACARGPQRRVPARPAALPLWRDARPGTWAAPLPIGTLPFTDRLTTAVWGERKRARDVCAPAYAYPGPEVTYEITLRRDAILWAAVTTEPGVTAAVELVTEDGQCLMRSSAELSRALAAGRYRLVVDTRPASGGAFLLDVWSEPPRPEVLGSLWNTYYYLANEADHEGEAADTPLLTADCAILADVPQTFHDDLCIEGSGLLRDGRVINYASNCTNECLAAVTCGRRPYKICYRELDGHRYPYGLGAEGRTLEPDRSIAVDPLQIPLGTILYLPELDGVIPPGRSAPHDGCLRADDIGGGIRGDHFDFYATTRQRWRAWERIFPTRTWFTAIRYHPRCYHLLGAAGGEPAGHATPGPAADATPDAASGDATSPR